MSIGFLHFPERSQQAIPDLLDLSKYYTHTLDGEWLTEEGVNLHSFPQGVHTYENSEFDIRGIVQLSSEKIVGLSSVLIKVGMTGRTFHFLHGVYGGAMVDVQTGSYVIRYVNGAERRINLIYGRNVKDVCDTDLSPLTDAELVVIEQTSSNKQLQLSRYTANNPIPDIEVESIEFVSDDTCAAPFVIAITLERENPVIES